MTDESAPSSYGEATESGLAYQGALRKGVGSADTPGAVQLAAALRRVIRLSTGSICPDEELADVARAIDVFGDRLASGAQPSRYPGGRMATDLTAISRNHPMFGPANAVAPPLVPEIDGGRVRMQVTYGPQYEGPAGFVHGGHIAAGFDGVLAVTGGVNGAGGLTRTLAIRYRRPAPLGVALVYEGWVDSSDERTTFIHGVLRHGDEVCAECKGEFARRHGVPPDPAAP